MEESEESTIDLLRIANLKELLFLSVVEEDISASDRDELHTIIETVDSDSEHVVSSTLAAANNPWNPVTDLMIHG